jgi:hypothetical protein
MRSAKVMANALSAGFHLVTRRACPSAFTARRNLAFRPEFVHLPLPLSVRAAGG